MAMESTARVVIIGCGAAERPPYGRRLAAAINTKITHLDALSYDEWNTLPHDTFAALQEELVAADTWVIDGNYGRHPAHPAQARHPRDLPGPARHHLPVGDRAGRWWRYRGGQHDATGVYDRITCGFITYVWRYQRDMGPRVRALIAEHADHAQVHLVRSRRAANRLVERVEQVPARR